MKIARLICISLVGFGVLYGQPLDTMLVLEMSPGTERAIDLIRPDVLHEDDRAGVIGFFNSVYVLQPLTENRDALAAALQRVGVRVGIAIGGPDRRQIESNFTVELVAALKKACGEFGQRGASERQRAILVFFAGEDPVLTAHLDTLEAMLGAANARLYAVVVPRINAPDVPKTTQTGEPILSVPSPSLTAQLISQLAEKSGGRIFRRNWELKEILRLARRP
jgi:hypothetical protein